MDAEKYARYGTLELTHACNSLRVPLKTAADSVSEPAGGSSQMRPKIFSTLANLVISQQFAYSLAGYLRIHNENLWLSRTNYQDRTLVVTLGRAILFYGF